MSYSVIWHWISDNARYWFSDTVIIYSMLINACNIMYIIFFRIYLQISLDLYANVKKLLGIVGRTTGVKRLFISNSDANSYTIFSNEGAWAIKVPIEQSVGWRPFAKSKPLRRRDFWCIRGSDIFTSRDWWRWYLVHSWQLFSLTLCYQGTWKRNAKPTNDIQ